MICRVSFIDLYLVFPRNVRIVFLTHTNTVILLEPCFGTIKEPGLPVLGTHALVGTLSGVSTFDFSHNCVQEFIADTKLHELALQRGKIGRL